MIEVLALFALLLGVAGCVIGALALRSSERNFQRCWDRCDFALDRVQELEDERDVVPAARVAEALEEIAAAQRDAHPALPRTHQDLGGTF